MTNIRPISTDRATADFFTGSYRLSATIQTYKRSLIDILSDQGTKYLDLLDVYVSRVNSPGDIIATYPNGSLVKDEINFILLSNEEDSKSKQRFYAANRSNVPIFSTVPSFELQGTIQWLGEVEIKKILAPSTQKFLVVLNGTATNSFVPQITFQGPAILVNKAKIEVMCLGDKK